MIHQVRNIEGVSEEEEEQQGRPADRKEEVRPVELCTDVFSEGVFSEDVLSEGVFSEGDSVRVYSVRVYSVRVTQ